MYQIRCFEAYILRLAAKCGDGLTLWPCPFPYAAGRTCPHLWNASGEKGKSVPAPADGPNKPPEIGSKTNKLYLLLVQLYKPFLRNSQVPRFTAFAGDPIFTAGPVVRAAAANFLYAAHGTTLPSMQVILRPFWVVGRDYPNKNSDASTKNGEVGGWTAERMRPAEK